MSNKLSEQSRLELAALAAHPDDVDTSDIPETQAADWQGATRGRFYRPVKQQVTVRRATKVDSTVFCAKRCKRVLSRTDRSPSEGLFYGL